MNPGWQHTSQITKLFYCLPPPKIFLFKNSVADGVRDSKLIKGVKKSLHLAKYLSNNHSG